MRLIIIDDNKVVLKFLEVLLMHLSEEINIIMIHCNKKNEVEHFMRDRVEFHTVESSQDLYKLCDELGYEKTDRYLIDVTLFGETQINTIFNDYVSVKLANYIEEKKIENLKIQFYTSPKGLSANDFVEETKKWGKPLYRPNVDDEQAEESAKINFVKDIKEFCNV